MSTKPLPWPHNANQARVRSIEAAQDADELIDLAIQDIKDNPDRCELRLAYAKSLLRQIQLELTRAKIGEA